MPSSVSIVVLAISTFQILIFSNGPTICFPLICIASSSPYSDGDSAKNFPVIVRPSSAMYGHTMSSFFEVTSLSLAMFRSSFRFPFVAEESFKIIEFNRFYFTPKIFSH
jgi:hypothetical protein